MLKGIHGKEKVQLPLRLMKNHTTKMWKSGGIVPCTQQFFAKMSKRWINTYHFSPQNCLTDGSTLTICHEIYFYSHSLTKISIL